jgi:hypothetical protein
MTYIHEESVRAAAVKYARRQLAHGKSLGKLLLKSVEFGKGDIAILTPAPINSAQIVKFDEGHAPPAQVAPKRITIGDRTYVAIPKENAYDQLADVIGKFLENPEDLCLLENSLAQAGDGWLQRAKSRVVINGADVYHVLFNVDRDGETVSNAIREADGLPIFLGAVGRSPEGMFARNTPFNSISTEQLVNFAETVRCVFVGAYDGDGYVLWVSAD